MDAKELRQKTKTELRALEAELRDDLHQMVFSVATRQNKKVRDLRRLKRDLARVLTILQEAPQAKPQNI
jgi:ribosomal protein L29